MRQFLKYLWLTWIAGGINVVMVSLILMESKKKERHSAVIEAANSAAGVVNNYLGGRSREVRYKPSEVLSPEEQSA